MNPSVHTDDARFLALLERWLQGDFTRADERELRALTETDDFRREAWEGFMALPEGRHEVHLEALRRRLRRQPGGNRIPPALWAAAAAILTVLLVALYFFPPITENQTPAASREGAPAAPDAQMAQADSAVQDWAVTEAPDRSASAQPIVKPGGQITLADEVVAPADDLMAAAEEARPEEKKEAETVLAPAPTAIIRSQDSAPVFPAGPASGPQNLPATFPPGGPAQNMNTKMEPAAPDAARAKARTRPADQPAVSESEKKQSAETGAVPAGGWDNFRRYLRDNARLTEAARNNNVSGYVQLQFWVGQDGRPANITVLRSLGYGCDEEAKRLIGNVIWTPAAGPTTVEVPFVR